MCVCVCVCVCLGSVGGRRGESVHSTQTVRGRGSGGKGPALSPAVQLPTLHSPGRQVWTTHDTLSAIMCDGAALVQMSYDHIWSWSHVVVRVPYQRKPHHEPTSSPRTTGRWTTHTESLFSLEMWTVALPYTLPQESVGHTSPQVFGD